MIPLLSPEKLFFCTTLLNILINACLTSRSRILLNQSASSIVVISESRGKPKLSVISFKALDSTAGKLTLTISLLLFRPLTCDDLYSGPNANIRIPKRSTVPTIAAKMIRRPLREEDKVCLGSSTSSVSVSENDKSNISFLTMALITPCKLV